MLLGNSLLPHMKTRNKFISVYVRKQFSSWSPHDRLTSILKFLSVGTLKTTSVFSPIFK